jgi:hypothetical protein
VDDILSELPAPVLFNTWKHHAGALRERIALIAPGGERALEQLPKRLQVIGAELMDLYTGELTPIEIAEKTIEALKTAGRLERGAFLRWVEANRGYQVVTFAEEGSGWVLRAGDEGERFVHVHPARWAPWTCRIRANVAKTAIMVLAAAAVSGRDPLDIDLINAVRRRYLDLSPIRELSRDEGLRTMIELLRTK